MRTVDAHLLGDKMDEAVTHYINSHQSDEAVHVDVNALALNVQEDATRLNMLQTQNFTPHLCRQVPVTEHETEGQWTEELLDPDGRLAALMAHFVAQPRAPAPSNKDPVRGDVDTVILDSSMRLFNGPPLDQSGHLVVEVPQLPLPPLQGIKRCQETDWFHDKTKNPLKTNDAIVSESDGVLEIAHSKQQNKKSLPHKKRISRKLKKGNGDATPQQDIVVLSCTAEQQEEILPDSYAAGTLQQTHHMTHQVRPMFICQLCGEYYGEEQLKFYHHLKQHYEPHGTIIIENPVPDLPIDKMTNSCIVDNGATLPDSIVELSLENTVPKTIYQSIDKHMLYTTHDKTLSYSNNKVLYSMASMVKEPEQVSSEEEKTDLYETLDKLEFYSCGKCNKTFRKQKECEEHIKEAHSHPKLEEMGEFSEPEDLMEGIHVSVEDGAEQYEQSLLPHLTVDSGHVTQEHARHWYVRGASGGTATACGPSSLCPLCPHGDAAPESHQLKVLKEEVLQHILESDVTSEAATFSENMIAESADPPAAPSRPPTPPPPPVPPPLPPSDPKKKLPKKFECVQCGKCFKHRNSLLYHTLSHSGKQHMCRECGKGFYTASALKIHKRVHNGDKPHKCDTCGRDFRQWSDLTYHKISKHSDVKMFKCEYCGKEFARKYSLNVHRRIHTGERNYKCEYCTKSFSASSYRLSHMRTHTGDRPYKCSQCEKCFRVAGDLRRHTLIHDKARATASRLDHSRQKPKPKDPDEEKHKDESPKATQKAVTKKIAVTSTTKGPTVKSPDKKTHKPKKEQDAKKGAPNVTIDQMDSSYTNNVEVFYTRQGLVYGKELGQDLAGEERDMTILRPTFNGACDADKPTLRHDSTDGKMQIYTHIKKTKLNKEFPSAATTPTELRDQTDTTETGFIERLTALYNISAV